VSQRSRLTTALLAAVSISSCATSTPTPTLPVYLGRAHAHNDYTRARPLHDALDRGFGSIEVDVVLVDGEIFVAHGLAEVRRSDTLARLYLEPLRALASANGGRVYAVADESLQLLIDVKSSAEETYRALDEQLGAYDEVFTRWTKDGARRGPVTVVLSGNRAVDLVLADTVRYVTLDGRIDEERSSFSVDAMPLVSIDWAMLEGSPTARLDAARSWIDLVHGENRRVRFWGTPDRGPVWSSLIALGADHIGADDVALLERILRTQ
jgi:hypothetical protein